MAKEKTKHRDLLPQVLPDMAEWPLMKLSNRRRAFASEVVRHTMSELLKANGHPDKLEEEIAEAIYLEKNRIKLRPWPVDPKDEKDFWYGMERALADMPVSQISREERELQLTELMERIVSRYTHEIIGDFRPGVYRFAKNILPHGFASLLNRKVITVPTSLAPKLKLEQKIQLTGHIDHIRQLATKGTLIMVPTHFSNLDSLLMGWGIQALGLPAFHYGAGLNLFNVRILAYFMDRLGAYKVDRRKKNRIYLETLKSYSALSIRDGVHALFFPGGTRSRSGEIEKRLKLGLLSTAIDAQRMHFEGNGKEPGRIFIVPVVISYHFVLEAPSLIDDHLKSAGKERYYFERDELNSTFKMLKFLVRFFTKSSGIALSFGQPMDIFGHPVDAEGNSLDKEGRPIDIRGYFLSNGKVVEDPQRESEYSRILADLIVKEFHRINLVLSSHIVAFTAWEMWRRDHRRLDLYEFLRIPEKELSLPYGAFRDKVDELRQAVLKKKEKGEVDASIELQWPIDEMIAHGLANLGLYHARRTLKRNKQGDIVTEDLKLLLFYHNRLTGYGFEAHFG
jgi:glycerol-3-phosphate O-acyltransferase